MVIVCPTIDCDAKPLLNVTLPKYCISLVIRMNEMSDLEYDYHKENNMILVLLLFLTLFNTLALSIMLILG